MKTIELNIKKFMLFDEIIASYSLHKKSKNLYVVVGDQAFFEEVLDKLSDYLSNNGLDNNDNVNNLGESVEILIDIVSEVFYS